MKTLIPLLLIVLLSPRVLAADTAKPQISLEGLVSDINKEKEKGIQEFVSLVESKKDEEIVKALKADKNYALVNTEIKGEHILTYAIKNKMWKTAETLVKGGSNLNHKDKSGKVALMYAAEAKNKYLTAMIKASKADIKIKDNSGVTAEQYLKDNGML